ncbi:MAG: 30S ribosome-binding factor RbfA [Parachlamydiales bacterium]|jgi:ribosome-binding factor A
MKKKRTDRLNSLLKQVISEVIFQKLRNPNVSKLLSITKVDIAPDLHNASVSVSIIGTPKEKEITLEELQRSAGFIAMEASHKMVIRYFPALCFKLDTSVDDFLKIDKILNDLEKERNQRDH